MRPRRGFVSISLQRNRFHLIHDEQYPKFPFATVCPHISDFSCSFQNRRARPLESMPIDRYVADDLLTGPELQYSRRCVLDSATSQPHGQQSKPIQGEEGGGSFVRSVLQYEGRIRYATPILFGKKNEHTVLKRGEGKSEGRQ